MLEPTVLVDVTPEMKVVCEETFAPIVSVIPFDTNEETQQSSHMKVAGFKSWMCKLTLKRCPEYF